MKKQLEAEYKQLEREYDNLSEYHELYLLKTFSIGSIIGTIPLGIGAVLSIIGVNAIPFIPLAILSGGSVMIGTVYGAVKSLKAEVKRENIEEKMDEIEQKYRFETLIENGVLRKVKDKDNKICYTIANQSFTQEELNQQTNDCNYDLENNEDLENDRSLTKKR